MTRRTWMITAAALCLAGCNTAKAVPEHEAKVGCGMCRFHMEGAQSCFWAIELEGQAYAVVNANTPDHDGHAIDGMCVMDRKAVVAGEIKRGQFVASKFDLLPANVDPNAAPPQHDHEH